MESVNLFYGKRIRSCFDKTSKKRWFSVIDVCAVLTNSPYKTARNYWKWFKSKLKKEKNQLVGVTNQLKMVAADGKLRRTDVMSTEEILLLIQECPSPKADAFKEWLTELAANGEDAAKYIDEAVSKVKHRVGNLLFTISIKEFNLFDEKEPCISKYEKENQKKESLQNELEAA